MASSNEDPNENCKYTIKQISIDHKPEVKEEAERIIRSNGRIESYKGK